MAQQNDKFGSGIVELLQYFFAFLFAFGNGISTHLYLSSHCADQPDRYCIDSHHTNFLIGYGVAVIWFILQIAILFRLNSKAPSKSLKVARVAFISNLPLILNLLLSYFLYLTFSNGTELGLIVLIIGAFTGLVGLLPIIGPALSIGSVGLNFALSADDKLSPPHSG